MKLTLDIKFYKTTIQFDEDHREYTYFNTGHEMKSFEQVNNEVMDEFHIRINEGEMELDHLTLLTERLAENGFQKVGYESCVGYDSLDCHADFIKRRLKQPEFKKRIELLKSSNEYNQFFSNLPKSDIIRTNDSSETDKYTLDTTSTDDEVMDTRDDMHQQQLDLFQNEDLKTESHDEQQIILGSQTFVDLFQNAHLDLENQEEHIMLLKSQEFLDLEHQACLQSESNPFGKQINENLLNQPYSTMSLEQFLNQF